MAHETLSRRGAALALAFILAVPAAAAGAAEQYRFELAGTPAAAGGKSIVSVRLLRASDGKPVRDAVVFEAKADMGPAGMPTMTAPAQVLPPQDGTYRVEIEPAMAGPWAIHLAAKVQGETQTARGSVTAELAK